LGIPGDNITAILLGAFIAQGLRPGPRLFAEHGPMVFGILVAMLLANVMFLILGYLTIPLFARIVTVRKSILLPAITIFAFAGSYVFRSDPFDLQVLVFFGGFGYVARKLQFDVSPMVMAFILGPILEYSFGQTISLAGGNLLPFILFGRPFAAAIFMSIPVVTFLFIVRALLRRRKARAYNFPTEGGEV